MVVVAVVVAVAVATTWWFAVVATAAVLALARAPGSVWPRSSWRPSVSSAVTRRGDELRPDTLGPVRRVGDRDR